MDAEDLGSLRNRPASLAEHASELRQLESIDISHGLSDWRGIEAAELQHMRDAHRLARTEHVESFHQRAELTNVARPVIRAERLQCRWLKLDFRLAVECRELAVEAP